MTEPHKVETLRESLNNLPARPSGTINCPNDRGGAVYVIFGPVAVKAELSGCQFITNGYTTLRGNKIINELVALAKS